MITLDLPRQALRRRDPKNGLSVPPRLTGRECRSKSSCVRGGCTVVLFREKRRTLGKSRDFFSEVGESAELSEWVGGQFGSVDHVARRRVGARALARQTHRQGRPRRRRRKTGDESPARMRSSSRITEAASSTAPPRRSRAAQWSRCRGPYRDLWMAESARARTSSRRWRSARAPVSSATVSSRASPRAAKRA